MKSRLALTVAALLAAAAAFPLSAAAQDEPAGPGAKAPAKADPRDAVHAAWDDFLAAQALMKAARQMKSLDAAKEAQKALQAAQTKFLEAFAASDWNAYDFAKDKDLAGMGLQLALNDALVKKDAKGAIRAGEIYMAKLPDTPGAKSVAVYMLTSAYLATGDLSQAVAHWEKYSAHADGFISGSSNVSLGDLHCAKGDVEKAKAAWKKAADLVVADPKTDPAVSPKEDAAMRLALVGNPAPEIDAKTWIGGDAKPLSALKGQVVVVDLWHTWCPPCRAVMPALDALAKERAKDGLVVLGVTWHDNRGGFLPKPGSADGERIQPKDFLAEGFLDHLRKYRENTGIAYPFVVTESGAPATDYKLRGFPTVYVVGRDGKIAFIKVGSGDESVLKLALDHALAAPAGAPAPAAPVAPAPPGDTAPPAK